ncbi:MAG: phasin family protein, partial [Dokdonella sp.]
MFEQINTQSLALGKSYTDAFVKAQGLALSSFERITELNLKTFEDRVKASVDFWSEAAEVRDLEGVKAIWPKGVQLAKESAEKLYATSQEVFGVSLKTSEAIGSLAKGSFETTNDTIS